LNGLGPESDEGDESAESFERGHGLPAGQSRGHC
jgi:hypothetical protein